MPRIGSEQDYKDKRENGGDYGKLAEGEYVFEILDVQETKVSPSQFNETGEVIALTLAPVEDAEDPEAALLDEDGSPLNPDKQLRYYIQGTYAKPKGLGFGPGGASKSRRLLASALQQSAKDALDFEWDQIVGGKFIGSITINDNGWEKFETIRAYKGKKKERTSRPKPAVQAAKEVFAGDIATDDDDLPF